MHVVENVKKQTIVHFDRIGVSMCVCGNDGAVKVPQMKRTKKKIKDGPKNLITLSLIALLNRRR